jgi:UDP-glucose 6-dehydrogenase
MVKVSADDAFLATKISLIDAMANACEATGADVVELAEALAYDERTGGRSFVPGPGMGGGWLAKEIRAFRVIAMSLGLDSLANLRGDVDVSNRDWLAWLADLAREAVGSLASAWLCRMWRSSPASMCVSRSPRSGRPCLCAIRLACPEPPAPSQASGIRTTWN